MVRWPAQLLMALVKAYRLLLKPWLGNACRFEPTCSAYALQALQRHGATAGVLLCGWRLLRCQPWCEGGCDPVPDDHPLRGLFTRFTRAPADEHHTMPGGASRRTTQQPPNRTASAAPAADSRA